MVSSLATLAPITSLDNPFSALLNEFPQVTQPTFRASCPPHGVFHRIPTRGPPVYCRPRRLCPQKLRIAKAEFLSMQQMGIVRKGRGQWASPLHMVPKGNGAWPPCGNFRRLNLVSIPDRYPIPHMQDFTAQLAGMKIFSKIDLIRGYHQILVAPEDIEKTAIITPFGLWEFLRMPFGLRNSAQSFQRLMDTVLQDLPRVFTYIDDVLVASATPEQHSSDLRTVLSRLQQYGLVIRPEKCIFGVSEITFLAHQISDEGTSPLNSKIAAIQQFPRPESVRALQKYLGEINYYHRFIPHAASLIQPLYSAMQGLSLNAIPRWTPEAHRAFNDSKQQLAAATRLVHPQEGAPLAISSDASDLGVGASLDQWNGRCWEPLGFFSRHLTKPQRAYSVFDRELLAAYLAVRHFLPWIEGRACTLYTDHRPLSQAFVKKSDSWCARQQRQLSTIAEYVTEVHHRPGADNIVADALSRSPLAEADAISLALDFEALAADQKVCETIQAFPTSNNGLKLEETEVFPGGPRLLCDISIGTPRVIVPDGWKRRIFDALHGLSHPGTRATQRLIGRYFVWNRMRGDLARWCSECVACHSSKTQRHVRTPVQLGNVPKLPFTHLHVDLVGPLPSSADYTYLLTVLDRTTRWPEAFPLKDISARSCVAALISGWVARYGMPLHLTSDRGTQFTSALWRSMAESLGVSLHHTGQRVTITERAPQPHVRTL